MGSPQSFTRSQQGLGSLEPLWEAGLLAEQARDLGGLHGGHPAPLGGEACARVHRPPARHCGQWGLELRDEEEGGLHRLSETGDPGSLGDGQDAWDGEERVLSSGSKGGPGQSRTSSVQEESQRGGSG